MTSNNGLAVSTTEMLKKYGGKPMSASENRRSKNEASKAYLQPKYVKGLGNVTRLQLQMLRQQSPEIRLKDAISIILNGYAPELPGSVLLKMIGLIVREWEKTHSG